MDILIERIAKSGLVLDTDELVIYDFVKAQIMSSEADIVYTKGRRWVRLNKGFFEKQFPCFDSRSSQWFGSKIRSLCKYGILERLEEQSLKVSLGKVHYALENLPVPAFEEPVVVKEVKSNKVKIDLLPFEERKAAFKTELLEWRSKNMGKYSDSMYREFYAYWAERGKPTKKVNYEHMRKEACDYFEVGRRLATWNRNNYSNQGAVAPVSRKGRTE